MKKVILFFLLIIVRNLYAEPLNTDEIIKKIKTYSIEKYNKKEKLKINDELEEGIKKDVEKKIFKKLDFSEKEVFKTEEVWKEGIKKIVRKNILKEEYQNFFYYLEEFLANSEFLETEYSKNRNKKERELEKGYKRKYYGEFFDTEIAFNDIHRFESVERFMKRNTGVPTELGIELVQKNIDGLDINLYHLILSSKKSNNRNVAVIPFMIDTQTKTIIRMADDFVFVTPHKTYNGLSEFFNTFITVKNRLEYMNESLNIPKKSDKEEVVKIFNVSTHKIADTRSYKKYNGYLNNLLDEKMEYFKRKNVENYKGEKEKVSIEEYRELLKKARRVLHNYQYVEKTELSLPKNILQIESKKNKKRYNEKNVKRPSDFIFTYTIDKYNIDERLNLKSEELFKEIPLDDYVVYKKDKNGYLIDELKDEYSSYLKLLLSSIENIKIVDTDVSIASVEKMIQRQTGKATAKYIELVGVESFKYHYHITVETDNEENRNVLIVPITVDLEKKEIVRHNQNLLFISPWNVYNGVSEFFNTYLREYVLDGDYNYTKTLVEDNYRPYKEENNRYEQKYYRDYLYEKKRGYDSHGVGIFGKVLNDRESVEQYREYTDTLERDLREISNIGIDGRKESSRRSQTF